MTDLRQAAQRLIDRIDREGASPLDWPEYYALQTKLEQQQAEPAPPDDESVCGAWVSASDSAGIAYDGPSFERGYKLGQIAERDSAEKQQAEPVAWMRPSGRAMLEAGGCCTVYASDGMSNHSNPLYTTPPQRKPLTREQRKALIESAINACDEEGLLPDMERFAWMIDAVERAHRIGENK